VRIGDLNGDGRDDLLWNEIKPNSQNVVHVSLAKPDGSFDFTRPFQPHNVVRSDWSQYTPLLADVTGNGRKDVVWTHAVQGQVRIFVGASVRQETTATGPAASA
jgi:hypothetical protein